MHLQLKTVLQKLNHCCLNKQRCRMVLLGSSSFPSTFFSLCSAKVTEGPLGSVKNFWHWRSWQKGKAYVRFILSGWISPFVLKSAEQCVMGWERGKMWLWPSACSLWPWWKFAQPAPPADCHAVSFFLFPVSLHDIFYLWSRGFQGWHRYPRLQVIWLWTFFWCPYKASQSSGCRLLGLLQHYTFRSLTKMRQQYLKGIKVLSEERCYINATVCCTPRNGCGWAQLQTAAVGCRPGPGSTAWMKDTHDML